MKGIKWRELKEILNNYYNDEQVIFEDNIEKVINTYGEDWFFSRENGRFEKTN